MSGQPVQLGIRKPLKTTERARLVRRAKLLAWLGVGWHGVEAAVAVGAGLASGSIALIGFEADSLIESVVGIILLWRFAASRAASESAERRAQKLVGASFYLLAGYVAFEVFRALLAAERPEASPIGIGLATVTLLTMPPLAVAKARVGKQPGSSATESEGRQNMLCAYLSAALLAGLGANALFGLWWPIRSRLSSSRASPSKKAGRHGRARRAAVALPVLRFRAGCPA